MKEQAIWIHPKSTIDNFRIHKIVILRETKLQYLGHHIDYKYEHWYPKKGVKILKYQDEIDKVNDIFHMEKEIEQIRKKIWKNVQFLQNLKEDRK